MSDIMMFPKTVDEFMDMYKIVDSDEVYTNGAELVPIFRMKQWFEHVDAEPEQIEFEWCTDCKEYDQEAHCCHRWTKVIRNTVNDLKTQGYEPVKHGHWYDVSNYLGTGRRMYVCSSCGAGSSREDPYCWHCGSKMDVPDTDVGKTEEEE